LEKNTIGGAVGIVGTVGTIPKTPIPLMNISNSVIGRIYDQDNGSPFKYSYKWLLAIFIKKYRSEKVILYL
jgi:hypothetical protein